MLLDKTNPDADNIVNLSAGGDQLPWFAMDLARAVVTFDSIKEHSS